MVQEESFLYLFPVLFPPVNDFLLFFPLKKYVDLSSVLVKFYASFPFLSIFFYSSLKVSGLLCWLFFSFNFLRNQSSANDMFCFEYRHIFIIMIICVLQTHKDINNIQNRGYFKLTYVYLCMYIILCISYCKHSPNIANFLYKSTKAVHTSSMKNTPCHPRSYFFNISHKISQASDKKSFCLITYHLWNDVINKIESLPWTTDFTS